MRLLRNTAPELPALRFKTQQTEGGIRPDMWGFADNRPCVFIENKFWAGLTDQQPVSYIKQLATYQQPTVLLVISPAARVQTLWRELNRRLAADGIDVEAQRAAPAVPCSAVTLSASVILALTSWAAVLAVLESECIDDPGARGDIAQLSALCCSADDDANAPVSAAELTDQRTPAFILQLGRVVQFATDLAITQQAVSVFGLRPQASWDRIGRYVRLSRDAGRGAGAWFGIELGLWKTWGLTPLWLIFTDSAYGRGQEVRPLLEPWAAKNGVLTARGDNYFAIALEMPTGEEKDEVIRSLAGHLTTIADVLAQLPPQTGPVPSED